jgi:DNA polymerase III subunit gamma/tau
VLSPTRPGPEGSNRNEFQHRVVVQSPTGITPRFYETNLSDLFGNAQPAETETADGQAAFFAVGEAAPPYRVLARKYRPSKFAELIGQDAVVQTLTNAIKAGRLAQAWMLTGVRGVGKTTTARIIARALNCTGNKDVDGPALEPCGVCDNCKAIAADRHPDVLEMDAASRTGVDDIREIIDGVRYGATAARYKIYIIDEVHMLSKNAFNALLKTLEEPPPHVKFIFATTEIRKVPVTVLSRCQRFDLRRVDSPTLAKHFAAVSQNEAVAAEAEAIMLIARAADGSVRDGLSLLDQAMARGGQSITTTDVRDMLGLADRSALMNLSRQTMLGEIKSALATFDDMMRAGADPLNLLQDMADVLHMLTRAKLSPELLQGQELPEHERQLAQEMTALEIPALTRAWQILLKGITEVQTASNPIKAAEMLLIRLAYAAGLPTPADLVKQMRDQPTANAGAPTSAPNGGGRGGFTAMRGGAAAAIAYSNPMPEAVTKPVAVAVAALAVAALPQNFLELVALFQQQREAQLYAHLYNNVHPVRFEHGKLEIRTRPGVPASFASQIGQMLTAWTGQRWVVSVVTSGGDATLAEQAQAAQAAERQAVEQHPLVQQALQAFPGAKITAIRAAKITLASASNVEEDQPITETE